MEFDGMSLFSVPLLTGAERHRVLVEWNDTRVALPAGRTVAELFQDRAAEAPDAVAVVCGDERWTYARCNARANQLARHLRDLGVGPEVVVAVCLPRGIPAVVTMLAVLKAGGAYTLSDTGEGLTVSEWDLPVDRYPETDLDVHPDPANLACVIDGVEVSHAGLTRAAHGVPDEWARNATTVTALGDGSTAAAAFEVWPALVRGARVVLASGRLSSLAATVERAAACPVALSTSQLRDLMEAAPDCLGRASHLILTGDVPDGSLLAAVLKHCPGLKVRTVYGTPEVVLVAAGHAVADVPDSNRATPIGRPAANTTTYILDEHLQPVPPGAPGSLFVGGLAIARGYRSHAGRTARCFVPDPFSDTPGARLFRTGARARHLPDGTVQILTLPDSPAAEPAPIATPAEAGPAEQVLGQIWMDVLQVERVSAEDNFFQLGGDSILCIQVVARAARSGITIVPKDFYTTQTLRELAAASRPASEALLGGKWGEAALSPIQHWFFDSITDDRDAFAQCHFTDLDPSVEAALLAEAFGVVIRHHPTLGARFRFADGQWRQEMSETATHQILSTVTAESADPARWHSTLRSVALQLGHRLDIEQGALIKAALVVGGPDGRRVLVVVVHHLVVDAVSWAILFQDLEAAYQDLTAGQTPQLIETTAWRTWTRRLHEYARQSQLRDQLDFWCGQLADCDIPVDVDGPVTPEIDTITTLLDEQTTTALLREASVVYGTQINELLLAALLRVVSRWTGRSSMCVNLEGHGREDLFDRVDVSRTIGWFTSMFPLRLTVPANAGIREVILAAKESVRAVPDRGIGYGLLRYCTDPEVGAQLAARPAPLIRFNYVSRPGSLLAGKALRPAPDRYLLPTAPTNRSESDGIHQLEINAGVARGVFGAQWTFNPRRHRRATVQRLADDYGAALREIVDHCAVAPPERSARDLPLSGLGDSDVAKLMGRLRRRGER
jgi:non-ribosomal peptide synthase protein (TIGR01720 family)